MRIIAIENNIVVDVFECGESYLEQRRESRPDIDFIESEVGSIGQLLKEDGTFIFPETKEQPQQPQQPKQLTLEDLTIQNHAMLTYLMYGDQPNAQV